MGLALGFAALAISPDSCWGLLQATDGGADPAAAASPAPANRMNLFRLLVSGGWFMIPLLLLSIFGSIMFVERWISLRRDRILPDRLIERLGKLGRQSGGLDPRDAYVVCQNTPSVASDILRSVLVKVGRPHQELEQACADSAQRAAIRLQQPVSWIGVCAALAPLIGLLGTVWGITQAFYDMTQLEVGQNRADALSKGIYVALVTTIAGLSIAIPATIAAHFFENRIVSLLNRVEEMIAGLLPQLERFEGQVRFVSPDQQAPSANGASSVPRSTATNPDPVHGNGNGNGNPTAGLGELPDALPVPARPRTSSRPQR